MARRDLRPIVRPRGSGFIAGYRVPWGKRTLRNKDQSTKYYSCEHEAFKEATIAMCFELRDKTDCWDAFDAPTRSQQEAEALFATPKKEPRNEK